MPVTARQPGKVPLPVTEPVSLIDASDHPQDITTEVTDLLVEKRAVGAIQTPCTAPQPCPSQQADVRAAACLFNSSVDLQETAMDTETVLPVEKRAISVAQAPSTAPQPCPGQQAKVRAAGTSASHSLNPSAKQFIWRDADLVHKGLLRPNLDADWASVQAIHADDAVPQHGADCGLWGYVPGTSKLSRHAEMLPFSLTPEDLGNALPAPAKPLLRAGSLKDRIILTPSGPFTDKFLPAPAQPLPTRQFFTPEYFSSLHNLVAAAGIRADGSTYPALNPNYMGARIRLEHVGLKIDRWCEAMSMLIFFS